MREGDFELDGYLIGKPQPVYVKVLDTGTAGIRDQDTENPVGDNTFFGRDYLSGPTWTLSMAVTGDDVAAALAALDDLSDFWHSEDRQIPGVQSVLRFMRGGKIRRVYGRPRQFAYDPLNLWPANRVAATAAFKTSSPWVFEDEVQSLRLDLVPASGGGLTFPASFPWHFASNGERQGLVTGGGKKPAPFTMTIRAPNGIKDPYLRSGNWELPFIGNLAYDRAITVDTRTFDVSAAGLRLSRKARLADARISPGPTELIFGGIDPSGTAYCDVSWRRTFSSF